MERVNRLFALDGYRKAQKIIDENEVDRVFCRHDLQHSLDVARLMYIYSMESDAKLDKELIYAAALVHDIGRAMQYEGLMSHDEAGVVMAERLLPECGFSRDETKVIAGAVGKHRIEDADGEMLSKLLYAADKASRACYACGARDMCNWPEEKMNLKIKG